MKEIQKFEFRSREINSEIKIACPEHGIQETYDLFDNDKFVAIGCIQCYYKIPYKDFPNDSYPPEEKSTIHKII